MTVTARQLAQAVDAGIITREQGAQLQQLWRQQPSARFQFSHLLYYFGGLLAIGAMTVFMALAWEGFGGVGIVALCVLYAMLALGLMHRFRGQGHAIPAGICAAFVVAITPLATYGLLQALGRWDGLPYQDYHLLVRWNWVWLELATLLVGALLFWRYRYGFLLMPVAFTLIYFCQDFASLLAGDLPWRERMALTALLGALLCLLALYVDYRTPSAAADYGFWLQFAGASSLWAGLTFIGSGGEWGKLLYTLCNLGLLVYGVAISRRVFAVYGALGVFLYLVDISWRLFRDSYAFPVALTALGFGLIFVGIWWGRHEARLTHRLRPLIPPLLRLAQQHNQYR